MRDDAGAKIQAAIRSIDTNLAKMLADACIKDDHVVLQCRLISLLLATKGMDVSPEEIDSACSGDIPVPGYGSHQVWEHLTGTNYYQDVDYYS